MAPQWVTREDNSSESIFNAWKAISVKEKKPLFVSIDGLMY